MSAPIICLAIYASGMGLMFFLAGLGGAHEEEGGIAGALIAALFWPLFLPYYLGLTIRDWIQ